MQTQNYGVNGSQVNELGQNLPPMQVYGKYEPWQSFAASAVRDLNEWQVKELIAAFHKATGRMPSKYFSATPLPGLKGSSFHVPGLPPCFLDIAHDEGPERVE